MGKFSKDEFTFDIKEFIGTIKESDKHDWCKAVARISWNEKPSTLDIRNINLKNNKAGKGISLTDEEAERLADILLDNEYGSMESLEKALSKKRQRFAVTKNADTMFDEKLTIDIKMEG